MTETREVRIKRLAMRSMRRGIKEMDLILTGFANAQLDRMSDHDLEIYEALLAEPDLEIYSWILKQADTPDHYAKMIETITLQTPALVGRTSA